MMKGWLAAIAGIIILAAGTAAAWSVVQGARAQPPDGALEASGRIEGEEVLINSKIGGRVQQLLVREGDRVRRGQLVAVLGSDELEARVRQGGAQVEGARAQVSRAASEVEVLERQVAQAQVGVTLAAARVLAQQQQAQAAMNAAVARLAQARKASTMAQTQIPAVVEEARAALRGAEADLARARALQEGTRRDLSRLQALHADGAIAAADVDAGRTRFEVTAAQVEAASEQVGRARAALARAQAGTLEVQVREEEVRVADAQVEAARSQVEAARAAWLEVTGRREQQRAAERQVQAARASLGTVQAQLQAAIAARDELQTVLGEARVSAPTSGVVTSKIVNTGEVVQAGTPLVAVVDLQAVWLKVFVPEVDIGRLRLGMLARVYVDAFPGRPYPARVVEISQRAEFTPKDVQTREERVKQVFAVKLAVDNPEGVLKPGMPADARIFWKGDVPR
ncbi:MAG: efflux RND transporter periplasmic adaptor subunit [Armatimonadetes bacterium]|nr:efflux RND transporter periplasmic adaptor subunit [Armatimonadota bacterium]